MVRGGRGSTRLFVILDNLNRIHDHPRFLALLEPPDLRIQPIWTPTEASWLNLIQARVGVLERYILADTLTLMKRRSSPSKTFSARVSESRSPGLAGVSNGGA